MRGAYSVLAGKLEGKRQITRPRCKLENNFKMDPQEVGWHMDWIDLAQDRERWRAFVNTVMNLPVP